MKAMAQIKSILLAALTVITLVSASSQSVIRFDGSSVSKTIKVVCGESKANLVIEMNAKGSARLGVEKKVAGHSQFKMMNAGSVSWFESNGSIWINDQIQINGKTGLVSIFANVLPTEFAVNSSLCNGMKANLE
jgi:hypothetical protein